MQNFSNLARNATVPAGTFNAANPVPREIPPGTFC